MNKKVMILGAGEGQLPFLKICKKKGYEIIIVSVKGNYPCFELGDKSYYIDTRNKEEILEVARKEKIDAIITDQTDVSVPSVAYVAEKMGLRGIGYDTSLKFTNKYLMRVAAEEAGVCVPKFTKANNFEDAKEAAEQVGFPLIIKPVDSSGSRGVVKINNLGELEKNFEETKKFSISEEVIIEQFIEGKEYLVDGFAMDSKYINLDLGIKEYFDNENIFVSKMCMFSSEKIVKDPIEKKVLETNKKLIENVGLQFGITHAEYLYNYKDDNVYLVEVAARGGGVYLSSDLTPLASGVLTNERLIEYIVEGKKEDLDKISLKNKVSAWVCFAFPEGEVVSIDGVDEVKKIKGIHKVLLNDVYIGKKTIELCDDTEKYGPILLVADSRSECYDLIDQVKRTLNIKVKTPKGIQDIIW